MRRAILISAGIAHPADDEIANRQRADRPNGAGPERTAVQPFDYDQRLPRERKEVDLLPLGLRPFAAWESRRLLIYRDVA